MAIVVWTAQALVMSMVGSPACTVDKDRESVSKIFFKCDEKGEEKPVLRAESEYGYASAWWRGKRR